MFAKCLESHRKDALLYQSSEKYLYKYDIPFTNNSQMAHLQQPTVNKVSHLFFLKKKIPAIWTAHAYFNNAILLFR